MKVQERDAILATLKELERRLTILRLEMGTFNVDVGKSIPLLKALEQLPRKYRQKAIKAASTKDAREYRKVSNAPTRFHSGYTLARVLYHAFNWGHDGRTKRYNNAKHKYWGRVFAELRKTYLNTYK